MPPYARLTLLCMKADSAQSAGINSDMITGGIQVHAKVKDIFAHDVASCDMGLLLDTLRMPALYKGRP